MECANCKLIFIPKYPNNPNKYCSKRCVWDSNRDRQRKVALKNNPMKRQEVVDKWQSNMTYHYGKDHHNWKGGVEINGDGYRIIYAPNHPNAHKGKVKEHRLIMEKKLGRLLKREELVHHINGNKLDNHPENLVLTTRREHPKIHKH